MRSNQVSAELEKAGKTGAEKVNLAGICLGGFFSGQGLRLFGRRCRFEAFVRHLERLDSETATLLRDQTVLAWQVNPRGLRAALAEGRDLGPLHGLPMTINYNSVNIGDGNSNGATVHTLTTLDSAATSNKMTLKAMMRTSDRKRARKPTARPINPGSSRIACIQPMLPGPTPISSTAKLLNMACQTRKPK